MMRSPSHGDDTLQGGGENDTLDGGTEIDTCFAEPGETVVNCEPPRPARAAGLGNHRSAGLQPARRG
jgi:Ca2+-binding RTX toxin-like protein